MIDFLKFMAVIEIIIVFLVVSAIICTITFAQISLKWDKNCEKDLAGYKVYFGENSRKYSNVVLTGLKNNVILDSLIEGNKYFIAVTAYDSLANESGYSKEIFTIYSMSDSTCNDTLFIKVNIKLHQSKKSESFGGGERIMPTEGIMNVNAENDRNFPISRGVVDTQYSFPINPQKTTISNKYNILLLE